VRGKQVFLVKKSPQKSLRPRGASSEILSFARFSISCLFLVYFSFIAVSSQFLPQTAITQINRQRAERLKLPFPIYPLPNSKY
jgi:hypothetical protein